MDLIFLLIEPLFSALLVTTLRKFLACFQMPKMFEEFLVIVLEILIALGFQVTLCLVSDVH